MDSVHIPAGEDIRRSSTLHQPIKLAPSHQMLRKRCCCTRRWLRRAAGHSTPARYTSAAAARANSRAVLKSRRPPRTLHQPARGKIRRGKINVCRPQVHTPLSHAEQSDAEQPHTSAARKAVLRRWGSSMEASDWTRLNKNEQSLFIFHTSRMFTHLISQASVARRHADGRRKSEDISATTSRPNAPMNRMPTATPTITTAPMQLDPDATQYAI